MNLISTTGRITRTERRSRGRSNSPIVSVTLLGDDGIERQLVTGVNSSLGFEIENSGYRLQSNRFTFTKTGRIISVELLDSRAKEQL